jgi:hypothetical protein
MIAVKTGLTGRTVLLPSDDAEAYRQHLAAYENEYKPVGLREREVVQSLARISHHWRFEPKVRWAASKQRTGVRRFGRKRSAMPFLSKAPPWNCRLRVQSCQRTVLRVGFRSAVADGREQRHGNAGSC